MKAVSLVKIKNKIPLFKGEVMASAIELIEFEEFAFKVVAQKDLYSPGDIAVYIEPDFCLSDKPIFESFLRPGGDPKKCILGSNWRIRAQNLNKSESPKLDISDVIKSNIVDGKLDAVGALADIFNEECAKAVFKKVEKVIINNIK